VDSPKDFGRSSKSVAEPLKFLRKRMTSSDLHFVSIVGLK
jgi:hypothetical protein